MTANYDRFITSLGEPIEYESQLASDAKNLALWGLETLITRKLFGDAGKNQHTNTSSKQPTNHEVNTPAAKRDVNEMLMVDCIVQKMVGFFLKQINLPQI